MPNILSLRLVLCYLALLGAFLGAPSHSAAAESATSCRDWDQTALTAELAQDGSADPSGSNDATGAGMPAFWLSRSSAQCGETVDVHVAYPYKVTLEAWRVGSYAGGNMRMVWSQQVTPAVGLSALGPDPSKDVAGLPSTAIPPHRVDSTIWDKYPAYESASAETWPTTVSVGINDTWIPGPYILFVRTPGNKTTAQPFIVTDFTSHYDFTIVAPTFTWQAYNNWGAASLYAYPKSSGLISLTQYADIVNLNRPMYTLQGAYGPLETFVIWSKMMSSVGQVANWVANEDFEGVSSFASPKNILLTGHDEYWTVSGRKNLDRMIARGTNLLVFGGNTMYRMVKYDAVSRKILVRKSHNPLHVRDKAFKMSSVYLDAPTNWPQSKTIGLDYACQTSIQSMVIDDPSFWAWKSLKPKKGQLLTNMLGYEVDRVNAATGYRLVKPASGIAHCVDSKKGQKILANFVYFTHVKSRAGILNVGTTGWSSAFNNLGEFKPRFKGTDARTASFVTKVTQKILTDASLGPLGNTHPVK